MDYFEKKNFSISEQTPVYLRIISLNLVFNTKEASVGCLKGMTQGFSVAKKNGSGIIANEINSVSGASYNDSND